MSDQHTRHLKRLETEDDLRPPHDAATNDKNAHIYVYCPPFGTAKLTVILPGRTGVPWSWQRSRYSLSSNHYPPAPNQPTTPTLRKEHKTDNPSSLRQMKVKANSSPLKNQSCHHADPDHISHTNACTDGIEYRIQHP